ncbi:DNA repair protein REV1-like Protein [Tribolium castaneum]|uniref:DNA repair protein REV1 n=1 Tax=Tribolium castaneum TaxID=7070 RepID=D2A3T9_TRICA|nr:PREDICTED: DNA repair protein REV1 [Tribolium castaneum]EFA04888.1 DNA repair protein REV1-like Protein [Tribolium castaneum]|eukprot:XP_968294.1 PREDICTED: DNA repair protein REV1 [Tribolium castaneum]
MSRRRQQNRDDEDNGFAEWGGYMEAKKAKLREQYKETTAKEVEKLSDIFTGVSILVNGLTNPSSDQLKLLMAQHGGTFHLYQSSTTTHIIASNLPNVKINKLGSVPIVKPSWITDSIALNKLLDYKRYLLYTNQTTTQPPLDFPVVAKTASDPHFLEEFYSNSRLHLISTLGAEYKQFISDLREKPRDFPGRVKLSHVPKTGAVPQTPVVMHIDMDCFFVSVGLRTRPELRGLPVAVTHARRAQLNPNKEREETVTLNMDRMPEGVELRMIDGRSSMSEVASCSYEARKCGVKNGMFLGAAAKLCPQIKTIPYDFEGYKEVSMVLYKTLASYTLNIEAVSCDEMYVEVSDLLKSYDLSVEDWANHIRDEIKTATGCPCSTGFGSNRLQARLATKKAKPDGSYYLKPEDVESYLAEIALADLPGVGYATLSKLKSLGLETCGDVQVASLGVLQRELGAKMGETLLEQAKGIDRKPLNYTHERKSVSAEINYGIRFKTINECYNFLESLGNEVWSRLNEIKMRAKTVTLKLMIRAADAPLETAKFLGHGLCDSVSKSQTLAHHISDVKILHREVRTLYDKMNVNYAELRGLGVQLTKLEKLAPINPTLSNFLQQESKKIQPTGDKTASRGRELVRPPSGEKVATRGRPRKNSKGQKNSLSNFFKNKKEITGQNKSVEIKKAEVDLNVLQELPPEIRAEIIKEYNLETPAPKPPLESPETAPPAKKSPFSGLNWPQLKPILYKWLQSEQKPDNYDVVLLGEHFRQSAITRDIDWLPTAMNFLYRNFAQMNCCWHKAYHKIVDLVQQGMVARYGGTLLIKRDFDCLNCF